MAHQLNPNLDVSSKDLPIWERFQEAGRTRPMNRDVMFKNLVEVCDILSYHGVKYWLSHGTMLGAYREQNFIIGDDDCDLGYNFAQRESAEMKAALQDLRNLEYIVVVGEKDKPVSNENAPWYDINLIKSGEKVEMWGFELIGDHYIYDFPRCGNHLKHPRKYYDNLNDFVFRGQVFKIPSFIEDWLVLMYGKTWNIPLDEKYRHG